ncbi:hypothetical protein C2S51_018491 [Perilla frutescens var. frutescens]|nr:hypothetical protein C2S51_018491 [Perilla frutescens var. frutescens]
MFLFLQPASSTSLVAKPGCQARCGSLSIPYPFGVGSNCSLDHSFTISCSTSTDPPKAFLSILKKEVIEINETFIRVKYPNLVSAKCYDLSGNQIGPGLNLTAESYNTNSMSVNLSGTPYTLSDTNRLTTIGCNDAVLQSNGSSIVSGCSAFCVDKNDIGGMGHCPNNVISLANGCCQAGISRGAGFLGAQLIDLSGELQRPRLYPCSYAFIQEALPNETSFSYPLYYLDNSTAIMNDNWVSSTRPPVVRLDWTIGVENCNRAKLNSRSYACKDAKSLCVDDPDIYDRYLPRGYLCRCVQGYEGNPYLLGGCKPISFSSSIAKYGCPDRCGQLSIPFPFGVGKNCYLAPSFEIICNTSSNPPKPYLSVLNAEIHQLMINSSQVQLKSFNLSLACYNWSDYQHRIVKTEERSLIIDLSKTQYTLSDDTWITAIGIDAMVMGIIRQANQSFIGSICLTIFQNSEIYSYLHYGVYYGDGECPYGSTEYWPGDGCCMTPIPRGTSYVEANLSDLSGRWPHSTNLSCSYAFVEYKDRSSQYSSPESYPILIDSTMMAPRLQDRVDSIVLALDWRIGTVTCNEAQRNLTTFACKGNTTCVDVDATIGGYLCNCSKGYQGNPYLSPGCQGYYGDGKKDGTGCIHLPPSNSKMIILTGMGSGLGFLLLLLICIWLYKLLRKRKEKILKDKFFKRNGGLLLRQHTNEGTLGKTKVFPAEELEVATDNFNENRILGHGGQGTVYKGMLSDGKIVAIKKSKLVEENQLEEFINEVAILSQINHRNVVKLLGCCLETEVPLLVYEFMPNGNLFNLIHDPNNEFPFTWNMRLKIAADIASALAYLHSASSMPIYHRDIKSSNILLDEKYVVKVSDFGTSRSVAADQTHLTTLVKGTFGYLDPEYFRSGQFTEKSDVYSFGVVLVELLTRKRPISLDKSDGDRGLAARFLTIMEENHLDTILDPRVSCQGRKEEVILVSKLAQRCLNLKGIMRPTMKEVATELENCRISLMSTTVKDESKDESVFEDMPMLVSDIKSTWTGSYKSRPTASFLDTHPLIHTN